MQIHRSLLARPSGKRRIFVLPVLCVVLFWRFFVSPFLPASCRFLPTCSSYAQQALLRFGLFRGLLLTGRRLLRCHPWGGDGYDPLPPHNASRRAGCTVETEDA